MCYLQVSYRINEIDTAVEPRLSEDRLLILQLISQHPELSLYSLNSPMAWAGGVTLLGLMSWLNMPSEIMCLLDLTQGLLEVNAMDEQGATPLMYAARDGNIQVVQHLLAHGARPDLKDVGLRSAIQYALPHPQSLWLCEEAVRRSRRLESLASSAFLPKKSWTRPLSHSSRNDNDHMTEGLFYSPSMKLLVPPSMACFDVGELRRTFETLLLAIRTEDLRTLCTVLSLPCDPLVRNLHSDPLLPSSKLLINLRDGAGLTLVHHAVSQRPSPSLPVLDALYSAGADIGLFSALGFTPLHHLARTAKEDADGRAVTPVIHPLYTFTRHIVRDLRAPLGATDNKGETPMHAAAEHGHSASVLQAMLDCDRQLKGMEAIRETRNSRGLRPVDVARSEFLHLFLDRYDPNDTIAHDDTASPLDSQPHIFAHSVVPDIGLAKKDSYASFTSRSSISSSTSSGARSFWLHSARRSVSTRRSYAPKYTLPAPDPTSSRSLAGSPPSADESSTLDVSACALDIIYNLSFCASAIHTYAQPQLDMYEMEIGSLPELPTISDTLLFTRDLASRVLERWGTQLELAREEFERAQWELSKAESLRDRVEKYMGPASKDLQIEQYTCNGIKAPQTQPKERGMDAQYSIISVEDQSTACVGDDHSSDTNEPTTNVQIDKADALKERFDAVPTGVNEESPEVTSANEPDEARYSSLDFPAAESGAKYTLPQHTVTVVPTSWLEKAPKILQRVDQDLRSIIAYFSHIQHSYIRATHAIAQARMLVDEAIKAREDQLTTLFRMHHHQDFSSRLSPIPERSPDVGHARRTGSESGLPFLHELASFDACSDSRHGPLVLLEEPHMLRRILTHKLRKYVDSVFKNLHKAHVWLRIIREVLRGLRRRVFIEQ
ncbi:hypothetical protein K439DRAFT_672818 [Ramaria rubella]|nr:hypothetical protein K439DRAFT_672818 [Ramaria rubella]